MIRRVLLCMLGEVPEVMCRVLLYMLEAVINLEAAESSGGSGKAEASSRGDSKL